MISAAQWKAYNEAVESVRSQAYSAAEAEVLAWYDMHPGADVAEAREAAKDILSGLVQTYDQAGAALAASWYDSRGKAAGARLDRAVTSVTYTKHDVDKLVRYQAEKLVSGDVDGFAAMCGEYASNDAMKSVNRTVLSNARRDSSKGVRFARVTSGLNTCAFCLMLAGRGAVYNSRKSAGEFDHWHRHCTCKVVPSFTGNTYEVLVEGHDPKKIEDRLKEVESLTGAKRGTKEFTREVSLRDPEWLLGGDAAAPHYLDSEVEKKKLADKDHPAELRTASRLSAKGFSAVFVNDELRETVVGNSWSTVVGLPDLESGIEIKNVSSARSENTISSHIGRAKKKRGLTALVIDVSENPNLSDAEARDMIARSLIRHSAQSAYMVGHSGEVVLVRTN